MIVESKAWIGKFWISNPLPRVCVVKSPPVSGTESSGGTHPVVPELPLSVSNSLPSAEMLAFRAYGEIKAR